MSFSVISFFSGAMGLDIGLEMAGLTINVGQDFEPDCVATARANNHQCVGGDIREILPQQMLEAARLNRGEAFHADLQCQAAFLQC